MFVNQNLLYRLRLKIPEGQSCNCVSSKQIEMQTCRPACRTRTSGPEPRFWVTLILSWRKPFNIVMLPYQRLSSWASLFLLSISKCFKCITTHDVTVPHCTTFHRYTPSIHKMRFRICKQFKGRPRNEVIKLDTYPSLSTQASEWDPTSTSTFHIYTTYCY